MSKLIKNEYGIDIWFSLGQVTVPDEKVGTFWSLNCDKHGDTLHFTDKSGADNCIKCIEELVAEL